MRIKKNCNRARKRESENYMKTVKPVDKATLECIGAAYAICSRYPDVFGDVKMQKFCDMFVDDIIDDGEELVVARKKAYAGEMYDFLDAIAQDMSERGGYEEYVSKIAALLDRIDGKEDADDE